jgi:hypothetical protein
VRDRNVFERDFLEHARVAQALHGVENFNLCQTPIGIKVRGNAFVQMFRRSPQASAQVDYLRIGCRHLLDKMLFFWSQHGQGNANEDQHGDAHEFSVLDEIAKCLKSHESGVEETRPGGKGNEAAVCRWVARCQQQENAERDINTQHHRQRRLLPHQQNQGIDES